MVYPCLYIAAASYTHMDNLRFFVEPAPFCLFLNKPTACDRSNKYEISQTKQFAQSTHITSQSHLYKKVLFDKLIGFRA